VESIACPLFVPLAEEGLTQHSLTDQVIDYYLSGQKSPAPDILLLGCTHYPLLLESFRAYFPDSVKIVDSASACAAFTADYLNENNMAAAENQKGSERFYVTDLASDFHGQASRFLGKRIRHVEKVIL
jgi:glutamate racemase